MRISGKGFAAALVIVLIAVAWGMKRQSVVSRELQTAIVERESLRTKVVFLEQRLMEISNRVVTVSVAQESSGEQNRELLKLRSEVAQLRQATNQILGALQDARRYSGAPAGAGVQGDVTGNSRRTPGPSVAPSTIAANIANTPIPSSTLPARPPDPQMLQTTYDMSRLGELNALQGMLEKNPDFLNTPVGVRGSTLLHTAAYNSHTEVIEELLKRGAIVDQRNFAGETPLFSGVLRGDQAVIEALLRAGANPNTPDNNGLTPLKVAIDRKFTGVAEMLRKHGATE
jgi:hypothetical protein